MRICMLATFFPRYEGDIIPQFLLGFSRALVEEGAAVTMLVPHDHTTVAYEIMGGVEVRRFPYWWPKSKQGLCYGAGIPTNIRRRNWLALQLPTLEAAFFAAAIRYGRKADIFNAHWTFSAYPTVFASKLLNKPLVTHAYSAEFVPKFLRPINRFIIRNSAAIISNSYFTHDIVELVAKPKKHFVIGSGVNPEKIAPAGFDDRAFRRGKGISDDEFLIFAVGRLVERKGYPILIEAVSSLIQQGKPVRLFIAGKGPQQKSLQAKIEGLSNTDRIALLGFVPDEELRYYFKAADVLVMPSIIDQSGDTEGLGIPLLEAMANSTPVIASKIGGILDIVKDKDNGLLIEPGNPQALAKAISQLQENPKLRNRLVDNGLTLINTDYSWPALAQRALIVYEELLRQR